MRPQPNFRLASSSLSTSWLLSWAFAATLLVSTLALSCFQTPMAHAEQYCTAGNEAEMYWAGDWYRVKVVSGPDNLSQCKVEQDGVPMWITRERLRPVGGGAYSDPAPAYVPKDPRGNWHEQSRQGQNPAPRQAGPAPQNQPSQRRPGPKPGQNRAITPQTGYCVPGSTLEMYHVGAWHPVTVVKSPDQWGDCMVDDRQGLSTLRVSKHRLRPVGGQPFATEAQVRAHAEQKIEASHDAAAEKRIQDFMNWKPTDPNTTHSPGAPKRGVYECTNPDLVQAGVALDPVNTISIVNGSTYRNFNGKQGSYSFNEGTGIITLTSGDSAGMKYKKMSDKNIRLLHPDGRVSGVNCVFNAHKNPDGSHW